MRMERREKRQRERRKRRGGEGREREKERERERTGTGIEEMCGGRNSFFKTFASLTEGTILRGGFAVFIPGVGVAKCQCS